MDEVALHGRAWDAIEEELEYAATTLSRNGRTGRSDDLCYIIDEIREQRDEGADTDAPDLGRYEQKMRDTP